MCTKNDLNYILKKIVQIYRSVYGEKLVQVILYGSYAVDLLAEGKTNRVVGYRNGEFTDFDIDEALAMQKSISEYMYDVSKALSI